MLQWLQHLDENVGIVSGDSLLLLRFSPCLVDTFRLVGLVLVGVVGLDSTCEGMVLMFHIAFDLEGITCEGFCLLALFFPNSLVEF